jgi:3,4-dihydroxy 2-butanone 4-phosphate synthase / GTP cyclohydrolase II
MTFRDPVSALRTGNLIVMLDDDVTGPTDGGAELWLAAEGADALAFARLVRHTSGFVSVAIPASRSTLLGLPAMFNFDASFVDRHPVQAVTCDAAEGVATGISAADRALTARLLADPAATPEHFTRPGHLVPMRVRDGFTDVRSPASAALELCAIADLQPAMIRCELVHDSGDLVSPADGLDFARVHGLAVVAKHELVEEATRASSLDLARTA